MRFTGRFGGVRFLGNDNFSILRIPVKHKFITDLPFYTPHPCRSSASLGFAVAANDGVGTKWGKLIRPELRNETGRVNTDPPKARN